MLILPQSPSSIFCLSLICCLLPLMQLFPMLGHREFASCCYCCATRFQSYHLTFCISVVQKNSPASTAPLFGDRNKTLHQTRLVHHKIPWLSLTFIPATTTNSHGLQLVLCGYNLGASCLRHMLWSLASSPGASLLTPWCITPQKCLVSTYMQPESVKALVARRANL